MLSIDAEDPEMAEAIAVARGSVGEFLDAFSYPQPGQHRFLIKARFAMEDRAEHIWLADLDFKSEPAKGRVANETNFPGLNYLHLVAFMPEQITDWMYFQGEVLVGAYTTRLLLERQREIN